MKRAPLRRKTPLRPRSKAWRWTPRRDRGADYATERDAARERAHGWCEAHIGGVCRGLGTQAHHRRRRSQGGTDHRRNLIWICDACHRWVHDHPAIAATWGLLERGGR